MRIWNIRIHNTGATCNLSCGAGSGCEAREDRRRAEGGGGTTDSPRPIQGNPNQTFEYGPVVRKRSMFKSVFRIRIRIKIDTLDPDPH